MRFDNRHTHYRLSSDDSYYDDLLTDQYDTAEDARSAREGREHISGLTVQRISTDTVTFED